MSTTLSIHRPAPTKWIVRAVGAIGTASTEPIVDAVWRKRAPIASERITGRVGIELVGAQPPVVAALVVVEFRCVYGVGIARALRTERAAELTEQVVDRFRTVGTPLRAKLVGCRVSRVRICAQLPEVLSRPYGR